MNELLLLFNTKEQSISYCRFFHHGLHLLNYILPDQLMCNNPLTGTKDTVDMRKQC